MFVVTQVATALAVLVGSTLVIRSFVALRQENLGFDPDRVLTFTVDLPDWRYSTTESKRQFYAALMDRIKSVPNVTASAAAYLRPLQYGTIGMDAPVVLEGQPFHSPAARSNPLVNWEVVTPDYFVALGITLKAGRFFTVADTADSEPVVIRGGECGPEVVAQRQRDREASADDRWAGGPARRASMAKDRRDRRGRAVSRDHGHAP